MSVAVSGLRFRIAHNAVTCASMSINVSTSDKPCARVLRTALSRRSRAAASMADPASALPPPTESVVSMSAQATCPAGDLGVEPDAEPPVAVDAFPAPCLAAGIAMSARHQKESSSVI